MGNMPHVSWKPLQYTTHVPGGVSTYQGDFQLARENLSFSFNLSWPRATFSGQGTVWCLSWGCNGTLEAFAPPCLPLLRTCSHRRWGGLQGAGGPDPPLLGVPSIWGVAGTACWMQAPGGVWNGTQRECHLSLFRNSFRTWRRAELGRRRSLYLPSEDDCEGCHRGGAVWRGKLKVRKYQRKSDGLIVRRRPRASLWWGAVWEPKTRVPGVTSPSRATLKNFFFKFILSSCTFCWVAARVPSFVVTRAHFGGRRSGSQTQAGLRLQCHLDTDGCSARMGCCGHSRPVASATPEARLQAFRNRFWIKAERGWVCSVLSNRLRRYQKYIFENCHCDGLPHGFPEGGSAVCSPPRVGLILT